MLYSPKHKVGFIHYPKTAGISLSRWFMQSTGDAYFLRPEHNGVSHEGVRDSCQRLAARQLRLPFLEDAHLPGPLSRLLGASQEVRIFGVLREPVDLLISLYEYWRHHPATVNSSAPLILSARVDSFGLFVENATVQMPLPPMEWFFDYGGPHWSETRLLDFGQLDQQLQALCEQWDLNTTGLPLSHENQGQNRTRPRESYLEELGDRLSLIHRHYGWYYSVGRNLVKAGGN